MTIKFANTKYRCNFEGLITENDVEELKCVKTLHTLQTDKPIEPCNWPLLEKFFSYRTDVSLRMYGFYGEQCDLSGVEHIPSLRHLYFDCLKTCEGYSAIAKLQNLETLSIGVENLTSFEFLLDVNNKLSSLSLGPTRSSSLDVGVVSRFTDMTQLAVCGHKKGFAAIKYLGKLTDLKLTSCTKPELGFLEGLDKLINLDVSLGGATNLDEIALASNLKYLNLCWIRGLSNLEFISDIPSLQRLVLDRLKQVQKLPKFQSLESLRWLTISDLKSLKDLSPIATAPNLEMLSGSSYNLAPNAFLPVFDSNSLKYASIYFSSQKKLNEFSNLAAQYGIADSVDNWQFQYI